MRTLCLLLLSCLACYGQAFSFADPTVVAWGGGPAAGGAPAAWPLSMVTNISGNVAFGFWRADTYVTNAGSAVMTDEMNGYNLSCLASLSYPPEGNPASLNGHATLIFKNANVVPLDNINYIANQPHEVVLVASETNVANVMCFFSSTNSDGSTHNSAETVFSIPSFRLLGTTSRDISADPPTNSWVVYDFVFTNTVSVYTNGILSGSLTGGGTSPETGMRLGARYDGGQAMQMAFAAMVTFTNLLSSTDRSNVHAWFTNFYATAP